MRHAKLSRFLKNRRAESLIETLVSITVIVISTTAALTVMRVALQGNQVIEKKIQAINVAEEGFEVLRNLRDTNYLLFSSDPDNCWNKLRVTDVSTCSSATPIREGVTYYFIRDFSAEPYMDWSLLSGTSSNIGYLDLYEVDLDGDGTGDAELYAQRGVGSINSDFDVLEARVFRRTFTVTYSADGDAYDATITVEWTDQGETKSVELTRTIRHIY